MAKISTYPNASSPQLSDMLIGSEVGDGNATKNFTIASILGLANLGGFVPYTGATGNVDLGLYSLTADSATISDGLTVLSGLAEFNGPIQAIGSLTLDSQLIDGLGNPGTSGQLLSANESGTAWITYGLQEVLDAGDTAENVAIVLTGTSSMTAPTIESQTTLIVAGTLEDADSSVGSAGQALISTGTGVEWQDLYKVGSFYDSNSQTTTSGVAVPMIFGTDDISGMGVSVSADLSLNKTLIGVDSAGVYNIQFSAQIRNGAGAAEVDIWFRKNGVNIPNSNTVVTMQSNSSGVASWNYFVQIQPGDTIQIMWTQNNNNAFLVAAAAVAPHPSTPSTILTVNRVSSV